MKIYEAYLLCTFLSYSTEKFFKITIDFLSWSIKGNFHYHKYIYLSWFMKKNQLIFVSKLIYEQKLADLYFCECYYQIKK